MFENRKKENGKKLTILLFTCTLSLYTPSFIRLLLLSAINLFYSILKYLQNMCIFSLVNSRYVLKDRKLFLNTNTITLPATVYGNIFATFTTFVLSYRKYHKVGIFERSIWNTCLGATHRRKSYNFVKSHSKHHVYLYIVHFVSS